MKYLAIEGCGSNEGKDCHPRTCERANVDIGAYCSTRYSIAMGRFRCVEHWDITPSLLPTQCQALPPPLFHRFHPTHRMGAPYLCIATDTSRPFVGDKRERISEAGGCLLCVFYEDK
jgi:hypothetical protein